MLIGATFAGVMSTIGYIALAILALMFMVVIHELGHYLAGKLFKFKILEFSIGFGPTLPFLKFRNKKNGELFAIRPIPLGGYCQFEDEDAGSDSPTAFNNQAPWKRIIVLFSGALFNFISGLIIITLFFTFYGQLLPSIGVVYPDSANYSILQEGDTILSVNGTQMNILMQGDESRLFAKTGDEADIVVMRDGSRVSLKLTKADYVVGDYDENGVFVPRLDENGKEITNYGFGFGSIIKPQKLGFFQALGRSFSFMFFLAYRILAILGQLVTGQLGLENAGGPITTISVMSEASRGGLAMLSYVVCLISANLAVMNLLPLPALDGSRIVFCLIEWIFKKPVNKKIEAAIHATGLILLFGFAIFADVFRYFIAK
ncbi:MAG: site-2 protease family protein [Clostridia bacterium]